MSPASLPPPQARGWASPRSRRPRAVVLRSLLRVGTLADSGSPERCQGCPESSEERPTRAPHRQGSLDSQRRSASGFLRSWSWLSAQSLGMPSGSLGALQACSRTLCPSVKPSAPRSVFLTDGFVGVEFGSLTLVEWGQVNIMCNFE